MDIAQQAKCISCHAADLKGQGSVPGLVGVGDILTKDELVDVITNGRGGMPSFKDSLSTEEIDQLSTWLAKQKAAVE
ncbi:Cytochrome c-551 precursor [compost metagenome]